MNASESTRSPTELGFDARVRPSGIEGVTVPKLGRHGASTPIFAPSGTCDTLWERRDGAREGGSFKAAAEAEAPATAPRNDGSEEGDEDDPVV